MRYGYQKDLIWMMKIITLIKSLIIRIGGIKINSNGKSKEIKEDVVVSNLSEYISEVQKNQSTNPGNYVFRGQSSITYHLSSSAARRIRKTTFQDKINEKTSIPQPFFIVYHEQLLNDIKMKGLDRIEGRGLSEIEILAELQHNGAATCLLDFTYNALVALWFACSGDSNNDCVVYLIDISNKSKYQKVEFGVSSENIAFFLNQSPQKIPGPPEKDEDIIDDNDNDITINQYEDWTIPKIWYWEAPKINQRIPIQQSIFIFGKPDLEYDYKIVISQKAKKTILKELHETFNINERTLYPDFSGYAKFHRVENDFHLWPNYSLIQASNVCIDEKKDTDIAESIVLKALCIDTIHSEPEELIRIFRKIGKLDYLIEEIERYLKLFPKDVRLFFTLDDIYHEIGDKEKRFETLTQCLKVVQGDIESRECEKRLEELSEEN